MGTNGDDVARNGSDGRPKFSMLPCARGTSTHRAAIAFGSNLGDRVSHIELALEAMRAKGLRILAISRLYQSKAMYYHDQGAFLNGVCLIETDLQPIQLLDTLQAIENDLGRVRTINKGPRTIDLDIILYDDLVVDQDRLTLPHPGIAERQFVVLPLLNILRPNTQIQLKGGSSSPPLSLEHAASHLLQKEGEILELLTPLKHGQPGQEVFIDPINSSKTKIMTIVNMTPDSFSDGGVLLKQSHEALKSTIRKYINDGAEILDIGGQSTRPNATLMSPEEELQRVLPILRLIRSMPEAAKIVVSLDTFYSAVVTACAKEDLIDIVNDVSGGTMDEKMLETVARHRKTVVLMHMRGTPTTMNDLARYPPGKVGQVVREELVARVEAAIQAGIPPWRIILDPGIGFAKTRDHNLQLLKTRYDPSLDIFSSNLGSLAGVPWLIGTSRKGFIGQITGVKRAEDRVFGTAATVTASVLAGAHIVRVHDTKEMAEAVKVADAIKNIHISRC